MMEGMVGEKGIVPERSEWFRSITLPGITRFDSAYQPFLTCRTFFPSSASA
jgi:hypothetical protein